MNRWALLLTVACSACSAAQTPAAPSLTTDDTQAGLTSADASSPRSASTGTASPNAAVSRAVRDAAVRRPVREAAVRSPAREAEGSSSAREAAIRSPAREAPIRSPAREAAIRSPAREAEGSSPAREAEGSSPAREAVNISGSSSHAGAIGERASDASDVAGGASDPTHPTASVGPESAAGATSAAKRAPRAALVGTTAPTSDRAKAIEGRDRATKTSRRAKAPPPDDPSAEKVLIVGDSMAATDFGRALQRRLDAHVGLKAVRRGKSATGLARPDYFDWMSEAQRQLKRHKPDLVVVIIGGNDGQDLIPKTKGRRVHWNKPKWKDAYAARVQAFTRLLMGDERRVAWIELPAMDRKRFERKLSFIREVQKTALAELGPRVRYVSTRDIFYDDNGRLRRKIKARGKKVALRQDDGIHFSLPGSQYFADAVYPMLVKGWDLSP